MSEDRAARLARIRVELDQMQGDPDIGGYDFNSLFWLLDQVSGDVEYRVEMESENGWGPTSVHKPTQDLGRASRMLARELASKNGARYRFRLVSAPVQVWTPVEEEEQ